MPDSEWTKVDFQQFINEYGKEIVINNAPTILYSKKDKEHEAYNSLIAFFFIAGFLFIYIALTYFLAFIFFNLIANPTFKPGLGGVYSDYISLMVLNFAGFQITPMLGYFFLIAALITIIVGLVLFLFFL